MKSPPQQITALWRMLNKPLRSANRPRGGHARLQALTENHCLGCDLDHTSARNRLSESEIGVSLSLSNGSVNSYLQWACVVDLGWPLPAGPARWSIGGDA